MKSTPALIIACLALLAALAGTSLASRKQTGQGTIHTQYVTIPETSIGNGTAHCPSGTRATGGGGYLQGTASYSDHMIDSGPVYARRNAFYPKTVGVAVNWHVTYYNSDTKARSLFVFVICTG